MGVPFAFIFAVASADMPFWGMTAAAQAANEAATNRAACASAEVSNQSAMYTYAADLAELTGKNLKTLPVGFFITVR